ncbi:MAG: hypothetical protein Kow00121_20420 [Elainellaceae cyanobacterium]
MSIQTKYPSGEALTDKSATQAIERIDGSNLIAKDFYQRYQHAGLPVVIQGLLDTELTWNLDYLCQHLGHLEFPVRHYGRSRYQQDKREWTSSGSGADAQTLLFADYVDLLRSGEAYQHDLYLARCSLQHTPLAELPTLQRIDEQLGLRFPVTYFNLWVGPGEHTSCLHYDPMDGMLIQLCGTKKVLLFPPSQLYNLYPIPVFKHLRYGLKLRSVYSQVYPDCPDFDAFPRFRDAIDYAQEIILSPGEMLFLPAGWWHEITAVGNDAVCSINRWWHVLPLSRALLSWSKWRAHFGSLLAVPHIAGNLLAALSSDHTQAELNKLAQRL